MSQSQNGRPLSRIQTALHQYIPNEQERDIYREVAIRGRTPEALAAEHSLTVAKVRRMLQRVRKWLEQVRLPIDLPALQALHLQRLEHQWQETMSAWYRSAKSTETVKSSLETPRQKSGGEDDGKRKVERTMRPACGDVRYLEQARKIMAELRKLTVEAAAHQQKDQRDVEELSPAERDAEAARRIAELRERRRGEADS